MEKGFTEKIVVDYEEKETDEALETTQISEKKIWQRKPWNQISSHAKSTECPECEKVFTTKTHMMTHYRSVHEGIKYPCNQCDYRATTQSHLQRHIRYKHEGIKYPCNQCEYQATQKSHLKSHIAAKHSDTIF